MGLKPGTVEVSREAPGPLKSDQNGIETNNVLACLISSKKLKSDQNGIETFIISVLSIHITSLKSDQNGIETLIDSGHPLAETR